jgi:hypothetical protein
MTPAPESVRAVLSRVAADAAKELARLQVYICLYTEDFERDPEAMIELGIAVAADKPVYIAAPVAKPLPQNLVRLAQKVERYDPKHLPASLELATERLSRSWQQRQAGRAGKEGVQ